MGLGASKNKKMASTIPDPTIDLHWDDFNGPVHSFFDANAKKHPSRICVIGEKS
jgi:L-aminoadipate-semialdehyde dehydrogenase